MKRIRPFDNGSQYADWTMGNCDRCTKYNFEAESPEETCDIEWALSMASADDGTISQDIADRCGYTANKGCYGWQCPEMVWTRKAADRRALDFDCADFEAFARSYPAMAATIKVEPLPGCEPEINEAAAMRALGPAIAPMLPGLEATP